MEDHQPGQPRWQKEHGGIQAEGSQTGITPPSGFLATDGDSLVGKLGLLTQLFHPGLEVALAVLLEPGSEQFANCRQSRSISAQADVGFRMKIPGKFRGNSWMQFISNGPGFVHCRKMDGLRENLFGIYLGGVFLDGGKRCLDPQSMRL